VKVRKIRESNIEREDVVPTEIPIRLNQRVKKCRREGKRLHEGSSLSEEDEREQ